MQPLISVIIPVYKVEAYLPACVDSVLAQTYSNLEIILVDDGSPDNCPLICDDYAAADPRIVVIHKENGGLSSARNAGIEAAQGELLAFLDSDDLWSPWFLERLYRAMKETDADFAVCLFRRFQKEPDIAPIPPVDTLCLSQREAYECLFSSRNVNMVVAWNKLYRAKLFNTIRYPAGRLHEDEAVIHEIIGAAQRVAWVEEYHHFYRESPDSITNAKFSLKRLDETYAKELRIAYFEKRGMQDFADRTKIIYLSNLMRLYRTVQYELKDKESARQVCDQLHHIFCQIICKDLMHQASSRMRLRCMLFKLFPVTFSALETVRLKRKGVL